MTKRLIALVFLIAGFWPAPASANYPVFYFRWICSDGSSQMPFDMKLEVWPGDGGVTWSPGVNPVITSARTWGWKFYTSGRVTSGNAVFAFEGDAYGGMFWQIAPPGQHARFDAHFYNARGGFVIITDPIYQRQGLHYKFMCQPTDPQAPPLGLIE